VRIAALPSAVLPKKLPAPGSREKQAIHVSPAVVASASKDVAGVYALLKTRAEGLTAEEAARRLEEYGPNVLGKDQRAGLAKLLWRAVINPLVILLTVLAAISFATGDPRAAIVMLAMILLSVGLKLIQEAKADNAAAHLKAMISVTATVQRGGTPQEIAVAQIVPGDVIQLAAGDMIPWRRPDRPSQGSIRNAGLADRRELSCREIRRGESRGGSTAPIELTSVAFLGTSVESGSASAVVVATGKGDVSRQAWRMVPLVFSSTA
jgi:Mg2+-importing ATPase